MNLTVCCVARNEEARIGAMLASVRGLVTEFALIDNASTDGTFEVCRLACEAQGIRFLHQSEPEVRGYPDWIYNRCRDMATESWTLLLDADEVLTAEGRDAVRALANEPFDVCYIPRTTIITGGAEPLVFNEHHGRLFRAGMMRQPEDLQGAHSVAQPVNGARVRKEESIRPYFLQVRPGHEQLARDQARGQYSDATLVPYWETIQGWTDYYKILDLMVETAQDGEILVEVGCWLGKATAYIAQKIVESGKSIALWSVDTFLGTPGEEPHRIVTEAMGGTVWPQFIRNMGPFLHVVRPLMLSSLSASQLFQERSVAGVFIDADHSYVHSHADILAWKPKVRAGGVFAGHDYSSAWPGVMKAVDELLPQADVLFCPGSWLVRE